LYSNKPFGIVGLQTDDTLFVVDKTFADTEEKELYQAKFMAKEQERLVEDNNYVRGNCGAAL
jgi:hypothetical protein